MKPTTIKPGLGPRPQIAPPRMVRSPLPAMVPPKKNPLDDLKPSDDLQTDVDTELGAMETGFRDRMKQEAERFDAATGSGEYFIVCFANGGQCAAFLEQLAAKVASVKIDSDDLVVDGRDLAKFLGFEIPAAVPVGKMPKLDPEFSKRVR